LGGAAIDISGEPLPATTLEMCRNSDAVLLAAIGGYKWDSLRHLRPESGLLALRAGLGLFANLRPASILPQLIDSSSLKRGSGGVDIILWWYANSLAEFTGQPKGILLQKPVKRGGQYDGLHRSEIDRIGHVAFETARKRTGKLCSVDKANVLEVSLNCGAIAWSNLLKSIPTWNSHLYIDNAAMQLVRWPKQFDTM
jgi:3-isopropylmalate dehydrogenase